MTKHKIGDADTLRIMLHEAGLDPKEGASAEDLLALGFTPVTAWQQGELTVFLDVYGKLTDVATG